MNRSKFFVISFLGIALAGSVCAQVATPAPIAATSATPVATSLPRTPNAELRSKIKTQETRIKANSKVGKLLTIQEKDLAAESASIRAQLKANYTTNGKKELTEDQKADLNARLEANEKKIDLQAHDIPAGVSPSSPTPKPTSNL